METHTDLMPALYKDKTVLDKISHMKNLSDDFIYRLRIYFKNGYQLSVVKIPIEIEFFNIKDCPYEIAVFDENENMLEFDNGDVVLKCNTDQDVIETINYIADLPNRNKLNKEKIKWHEPILKLKQLKNSLMKAHRQLCTLIQSKY